MKRIAVICALLAFGCSKSSSDSETKSAPAPEPVPEAKAEPVVPQLLAEGATAPDFTVKDHNGNEVALASLKGKPVVLYWYPKDETPG